MCIYLMYKTRTIYTVGQTVTAPDVWITNKLTCISNNIRSADIGCIGRIIRRII